MRIFFHYSFHTPTSPIKWAPTVISLLLSEASPSCCPSRGAVTAHITTSNSKHLLPKSSTATKYSRSPSAITNLAMPNSHNLHFPQPTDCLLDERWSPPKSSCSLPEKFQKSSLHPPFPQHGLTTATCSPSNQASQSPSSLQTTEHIKHHGLHGPHGNLAI
jgi:hypothetical protein